MSDPSDHQHAAPDSTPPESSRDVPTQAARPLPPRWTALRVLTFADLKVLWRSWLCRGFVIATALLTVLSLKGMEAEQKVASQMLEAVYVTYLVVWMHGVIFIAGAALSREQDCLNDAILSRGITRGEYISGKLLARSLAVLFMIGAVLVPCSFWAIRQDTLVRREGGYVAALAHNTRVEAWEPRKVFAGADGSIAELSVELGDSVRAGEVLALLDDRLLFDQLETERRAEDTARNEVANAQRRYEDAQRAVAHAEDAIARAERGLIAKDLLSRLEQADRETDLRARKRDLQQTQNLLRMAVDEIGTAERSVQNTQARVREARKRLAQATVTAPISGYVTELPVQATQPVGYGAHLLTLAPLDEFQIHVPVYQFDDFKRLKAGLTAHIKIGATEYTGAIDRLGATTQDDRWGRTSNFVIVRFQGDGALGLLGQNADVRLVLPPPEEKTTRVGAILDTLTGRGLDDLESRTASVTTGWMLVALGKVLGCALLLVTLTILLLILTRSTLVAVLVGVGLWHVSNLLFDFAGLPDLSYLEMVRSMDKVLGGVARVGHELSTLAWLGGVSLVFVLITQLLFISRDPPK